MTNLYRKTYALVDLDAYESNIRMLAQNARGGIMAVVKANAYGHGAVEISHAAVRAGAAALAVALPEEAIELREAGITLPIVVMARANADQAALSVQLGLEQCVFYGEDILRIQQFASKRDTVAGVQIKIDTGMGRIGLRTTQELDVLLAALEECPNVRLSGVFTHFSCADETDKEFTLRQCGIFNELVEHLQKAGHNPKKHMANSATCIDLPELTLDYARVGISSYGYYPSAEVDKSKVTLKQVMQVFSEISQIKTVEAGTPIGYNATFTAPRRMQVATVQIGYGDGYPRVLSNRGRMVVFGKNGPAYAGIVGRVCMDQTMLDVTGIEGLREGSSVTVMGGTPRVGVWADEIAALCDTISYEVLLGWTQRVPRVYATEEEHG